MKVLEVGEFVFLLRFLPDGRRLLVGMASKDKIVTFEVLSVDDGSRVRLPLPKLTLDSWWYYARSGNAAAVHPTGESCMIAWDGAVYAYRTKDGKVMPVPGGVEAHQIALSPDGKRLLAADRSDEGRHLYTVQLSSRGGKVLWKKELPTPFYHLAGFLPDGERFVTIDDKVRIRTFEKDEEEAATRYPTYNANRPLISPDGRHLGVIGYSCMYMYDLSALGKPRRIASTQGSYGNFVSFAFHPGGRQLAVIHGGPTLVKIYDVDTLQVTTKFNFRVGALSSVAFSPDGMLGAAGSQDGRIVLWDVDT